uniref:Uncharacterized protein n=1 Tax=viral metagenome TaxID=1070528 RepID=A0A6H1ZFU1_9ZZZZ
MTAEKRPNMFIVVAKGMRLISKSDFTQDTDMAFIFHDFDKAKDLALSYHGKFGVPCEICMLSSLTGAITPESLDSPMLDYVPQRIMLIENVDQIVEDLAITRKQNEEIAPLVEGWGKVMDIMAKLGNLIDKAKQEELK